MGELVISSVSVLGSPTIVISGMSLVLKEVHVNDLSCHKEILSLVCTPCRGSDVARSK